MKIKELRQKLGLSQRVVSEKLDIAQTTLFSYENGVNEPNIANLIKLADFYNVTIDELIGRPTDIVNLNFLDETRKELVKAIINYDDATIGRFDAFYQGIKVAEEERKALAEEIKKRRGQ